MRPLKSLTFEELKKVVWRRLERMEDERGCDVIFS